MVTNMTIYKRTERMLITTNMHVPKEYIDNNQFKISDIIDHLIVNEDSIVQMSPKYMELMEVCIQALSQQSDEVICDGDVITRTRPNLRPKTFFYPTCRIIRVDLTERPKAAYSSSSRLPKDVVETGYEMVPKKGAHSVVIIKIERMTDSACFATWSIVS